MKRAIVSMAALGILAVGSAESVAQEPQPGAAGAMTAQAAGPPHGQPSAGMPTGQSGGMMGQGGGMMGQGGGMMGMHRGPMHGRAHLEHLMVHDPKAAARIMRFRADMLKAMSEVLAKHAAELEKAQ